MMCTCRSCVRFRSGLAFHSELMLFLFPVVVSSDHTLHSCMARSPPMHSGAVPVRTLIVMAWSGSELAGG